jgi:hypothetical protein
MEAPMPKNLFSPSKSTIEANVGYRFTINPFAWKDRLSRILVQ